MLDRTKLYYLQQMGICPWVLRGQEEAVIQKKLETKLMVIGERSALLNKMFYAVGFSEQDVHFVPVLQGNELENQDASAEEYAAASLQLSKQLERVQPKVILALGRQAGQLLTNQAESLDLMRKQLYYYQSIPVLVSYPQSYLLRNPAEKKKAYQDCLELKKFV